MRTEGDFSQLWRSLHCNSLHCNLLLRSHLRACDRRLHCWLGLCVPICVGVTVGVCRSIGVHMTLLLRHALAVLAAVLAVRRDILLRSGKHRSAPDSFEQHSTQASQLNRTGLNIQHRDCTLALSRISVFCSCRVAPNSALCIWAPSCSVQHAQRAESQICR